MDSIHDFTSFAMISRHLSILASSLSSSHADNKAFDKVFGGFYLKEQRERDAHKLTNDGLRES